MNCPACEWIKTRVVDAWRAENAIAILRRRKCTRCAHTFVSAEYPTGDLRGLNDELKPRSRDSARKRREIKERRARAKAR